MGFVYRSHYTERQWRCRTQRAGEAGRNVADIRGLLLLASSPEVLAHLGNEGLNSSSSLMGRRELLGNGYLLSSFPVPLVSRFGLAVRR